MNVLQSECRHSPNKAKMASTPYEAVFRSECNEGIFGELSGTQIVLVKGRQEYEDWSMCLQSKKEKEKFGSNGVPNRPKIAREIEDQLVRTPKVLLTIQNCDGIVWCCGKGLGVKEPRGSNV